MKYCLFCRDAFEDEMATCPYCGDELVDELPDPDADEGDRVASELPAGDRNAGENAALLQVAIIDSEEALRAAVEVLKAHDVYFEIEETDRSQAAAGLVAGRAWRLLVEPAEAERAFLRLVEETPGIFPCEVRRRFTPPEESDEYGAAAVARIAEILEAPPTQESAAQLAAAVAATFASDDGEVVLEARRILAARAAQVAPLLAGMAAEAISSGGDGAERVLYNAVVVLSDAGYSKALGGIEPLYASEVPQVRARAAYAAGRLRNAAAVDALLGLLDDEDEEVRYESSEAVWRLTGMDFEFDPYGSLEDEAKNIKRIREAWAGRSRSI